MNRRQRLDKVLANSGYGTRKEVKKLVKLGTIKVNNETARDSGMHVNPYNDVIEIDGDVLNYRKHVYIMMNKPDGVISATYDNNLKTVTEILPEKYRAFGLFPVGRLDIDTEGLILLTNDGQLAHKILSPRNHIAKKYYALIEGCVTSEDVKKFRDGVLLDDGYKTMPAELGILQSGQYSEIILIIYEGKFHQVKRMFQAVGKKVRYLKRVQMGGLKLDENLKTGEWRELANDEVKLLCQGIVT
ncbi:MAG: pseudouridine synthase [Acetivibrionales bacterium]